MNNVKHAYLAGIVDGEGSLCIGQYAKTKTGTPMWTVTLQVSNTDEALIDWLIANFGSKKWIYTRNQLPKNSRKTVYRWQVTGKNLRSICRAILPFSVIKRRQIEIILEMFDSFDKRTYAVGQSGPRISQAEIDRRYALMSELRSLHARIAAVKHF